MEKFQKKIDLQTIDVEELNNLLRYFYVEVQPRKDLANTEQQEYNKNTLKSLRSAINRHLKDIGRDMDIVADRAFKSSNKTLAGKLKYNKRFGLPRYKQDTLISVADLQKISIYLSSAGNPIILRYRVWYHISIHFLPKGFEFYQKLTNESFKFLIDEHGVEYVAFTEDFKQKNELGVIRNSAVRVDNRMYATGDTNCPVRSLQMFIQRTDPRAMYLFNLCSKAAVQCPSFEDYWYTTTSVKPYQFNKFMGEISADSQCSRKYNACSLRATALQAHKDYGVKIGTATLMSKPQKEALILTYNPDCIAYQIDSLNNLLGRVNSPPATVSRPPVLTDNSTVIEPHNTTTSSDIK